jgi:hypothetical protein
MNTTLQHAPQALAARDARAPGPDTPEPTGGEGTQRLLAAAVALAATTFVAGALLLAPSTPERGASARPVPDPAPTFRRAERDEAEGRRALAYAGYVRAAALGHCEAARRVEERVALGPAGHGSAMVPPRMEARALAQARRCAATAALAAEMTP